MFKGLFFVARLCLKIEILNLLFLSYWAFDENWFLSFSAFLHPFSLVLESNSKLNTS